eukprot:c18639_g1_i1 orf=540-854(+)
MICHKKHYSKTILKPPNFDNLCSTVCESTKNGFFPLNFLITSSHVLKSISRIDVFQNPFSALKIALIKLRFCSLKDESFTDYQEICKTISELIKQFPLYRFLKG